MIAFTKLGLHKDFSWFHSRFDLNSGLITHPTTPSGWYSLIYDLPKVAVTEEYIADTLVLHLVNGAASILFVGNASFAYWAFYSKYYKLANALSQIKKPDLVYPSMSDGPLSTEEISDFYWGNHLASEASRASDDGTKQGSIVIHSENMTSADIKGMVFSL
jgi:hypothetical protein